MICCKEIFDQLSLIVGAVSGVIAAVLTAWLTHKNNLKLEEEHRKYEEKVLLIAIKAELENFNRTLVFIKDNFLKRTEDAFYPYLNIEYDRFSVYECGAGRLGVIQNEQLIKEIVGCYGWITGLYDMLDDLEQSSMENRKLNRTEDVFVKAHEELIKQIVSNAIFIEDKIKDATKRIDVYLK